MAKKKLTYEQFVVGGPGVVPPRVDPNPKVEFLDFTLEEKFEQVLRDLGLDLRDQNFQDTPRRWLGYMREFMLGARHTEEQLSTFFIAPTDYHGMIVQSNIPFRAMCAHHLLPFFGVAHVGYIPDNKVIGLSKIARLVEAVGLEEPGIQEKMTERIANLMSVRLSARGVIVVVSAMHTCMCARGVAAPNVPTITSCVKGAFRDVPAAREEFFSISGIRHL